MLARIVELTRGIRGLLRDLWKEKTPPPITPKEIAEVRNAVISGVGQHLFMIYRLEADLSRLVLAVREYIDATNNIFETHTLSEFQRDSERCKKSLAVIQTYLDAWEGEE